MEVCPQTLNKACLLIKNACHNAGIRIQKKELGKLALKIAFAASLQSRKDHHFAIGTRGTSRSPSLALASSMASSVRDALKVLDIEPLFDLPVLLSEKLGIDTLVFESERVAGGCVLLNEGAFVLLPAKRRLSDLFVCAHELGHLLLLSLRNGQESAVVDVFHKGISTVRNPYEHFADAFARELLIPARGLAVGIQEIRKQFESSGPIGDIELLYLSRVFGVSFLVMAKRCERLGLLPEGGAAALYKALMEQFGGPEKRADMLQLPARPIIQIALVPRSIQLAAIEEITNKREEKQQSPFPDSLLNRKFAG